MKHLGNAYKDIVHDANTIISPNRLILFRIFHVWPLGSTAGVSVTVCRNSISRQSLAIFLSYYATFIDIFEFIENEVFRFAYFIVTVGQSVLLFSCACLLADYSAYLYTNIYIVVYLIGYRRTNPTAICTLHTDCRLSHETNDTVMGRQRKPSMMMMNLTKMEIL